ncbi:MAG: DivIVA domain-containing protein [Acidimicrobiia bacterium]|nr:DivIVA domain-containing protein [Acidimicrobiia bacterium]
MAGTAFSPLTTTAGDVLYGSGVTRPIAIYFVAGLVLIVVCVGLLSISSRRAWALRTVPPGPAAGRLDPAYVRHKRFTRRHRGYPPAQVAAHLREVADRMEEGGSGNVVAPPRFGSVRRGWDTRQVTRFLDLVTAQTERDRHG